MKRRLSATPVPAPASRSSRSSDGCVYEAIYDAVMDHRLPPGSKLPEASLSLYFGVSRPVVRKALARLAHESIVCLRPNRSAVVASPSVAEARDVFEARRVVEREITRSVVRSVSEEQLGRLRALVDEERDAHARGDFRDWLRRSGGFHVHLAEAGGNAVLAQFLSELVSRTSLIIALYEAPGKSPCSVDEHLSVIEAIAEGDEARAIALMEAHLESCEKRLNLERTQQPIDFTTVFGRGPLS